MLAVDHLSRAIDKPSLPNWLLAYLVTTVKMRERISVPKESTAADNSHDELPLDVGDSSGEEPVDASVEETAALENYMQIRVTAK